jgi:AcrR family transcriptional regulator
VKPLSCGCTQTRHSDKASGPALVLDMAGKPMRLSRPPRTKRGVQKCEDLRQAAAKLFLARGFDGVSVDDIVHEAGGSKTNVYSYFGNKERLFVLVVEELCVAFLTPLTTVDVTGLPLKAGLRALGRKLVAILLSEQHVAFYRLVVAESGRFPEIGDVWRRRGPDTAKAIIASFIAGHLPASQPSRDTLRIARLFHDMLTSSAIAAALTSNTARMSASEINKTIDMAADLVVLAIQKTTGAL